LENTSLTPERVALGKALFYETRVSSDGRQGCVSCHNPAYYGGDSLPLSMGVHGKVLPRNAPTVFNTSLLMAQHYGGNRATVEEQAVKALTSLVAYGNANYEQVEKKLATLGYQPWFDKAFAGEAKALSAENWGKAIGAFERTLLTPAPFDRYLKGDTQALSAQAKQG
jgi:cytochrome c peroxidase